MHVSTRIQECAYRLRMYERGGDVQCIVTLLVKDDVGFKARRAASRCCWRELAQYLKNRARVVELANARDGCVPASTLQR